MELQNWQNKGDSIFWWYSELKQRELKLFQRRIDHFKFKFLNRRRSIHINSEEIGYTIGQPSFPKRLMAVEGEFFIYDRYLGLDTYTKIIERILFLK